MFGMTRTESGSASRSITYITVGVLMMIWSGVWYFAFHNNNPGDDAKWQIYVIGGLFTSGLAVMIIGLLIGPLGFAAKSADATVPANTQVTAAQGNAGPGRDAAGGDAGAASARAAAGRAAAGRRGAVRELMLEFLLVLLWPIRAFLTVGALLGCWGNPLPKPLCRRLLTAVEVEVHYATWTTNCTDAFASHGMVRLNSRRDRRLVANAVIRANRECWADPVRHVLRIYGPEYGLRFLSAEGDIELARHLLDWRLGASPRRGCRGRV